ncbi:uncharacterized protein TRAVEDRAFT_123436, partial [Trametes versicolor FP-101664 SS1]|uniref:uncharacterized protein n=1 Tax=Trametes versicolor (strain FP-101664) TaxID=717944 RepID=UPI0004621C88
HTTPCGLLTTRVYGRLYGITSVQAFVFWRRSEKDSTKLKLSVNYSSCVRFRILDTLHACLISLALYWYCVVNFTNLEAIQQPIWYVGYMFPLGGSRLMISVTGPYRRVAV